MFSITTPKVKNLPESEQLLMNKNRRVAVIGSGVSGAVAAWLLRDQISVSLLESEPRFGGHTHTVLVEESAGTVPVDTGFMVFNKPNYPLLSSLIDHLGVAAYPTDMSFSASFNDGRFEYAGSNLNTLFGQRRNLFNAAFWRMLRDILRFNSAGRDASAAALPDDLTLDSYLDRVGVGAGMRRYYLYPMAAAIWSCPDGQVGRFPAASFVRFFANHGLININDRPRWLTIEGGSRSYMDRLIADLGPRARCGAGVRAVQRTGSGVAVTLEDGETALFDDVVLACHSDQALRLLADADADQRATLGAIAYQPNRVLLHRDAGMMPRRRRVWSSWNYQGYVRKGVADSVSVTYWMNSLQRLPTQQDYFVSLNPVREPVAGSVIDEFEYQHPVFDADALRAQRRLAGLQGRDGVWFAGAWTGYGFHEDGMRSGVEVARALGATIPWEQAMADSRGLSMVPDLVGEVA
jgi:predicted NAD/FAD-binding protein